MYCQCWQFFPINDEINYRQPETKAIMNWIKQEHFTASASLHGVIISSLPLVCEFSLLFICYYPPTYVSVVKATSSNDEPHLSCICGLLSCSVDENAPKLCFVCAPKKIICSKETIL